MPNYKETTVESSSYTRCRLIMIHNSASEPAFVEFHEDRVMSLGEGSTFHQPTGSCRLDVIPDHTITIIDPATNLPTGQEISHGQLYQYLYSAYIQTALARDALLV